MAADPMNSVDPLIQRLRTVAQGSGDLPEMKKAVQIYEAILPLLRDADLDAGRLSVTAGQARSKLEAGQPLLPGLELELDIEAVRDLLIILSAAVQKVGERADLGLADAARRIRSAIGEDRLDVGNLLPGIFSGDRGSVETAARDLKLDAELLWTLFQNSLKPALRAWCLQLSPLAENVRWDKGYCFVCGAEASLGELRDGNQARHLRCAQCGADWRVGRLQCVYCGNEDHHTLSFLQPEGRTENMRVEVCGKCNRYLKVITTFAPTAAEMLAVEDLATLHLDYIARERGFWDPGSPRTTPI